MPAKPMKAMALNPAEIKVMPRPSSTLGESAYSAFSLMAASKGVYGEAPGEWGASDALGYSKILSLTGAFQTRAGSTGGAA